MASSGESYVDCCWTTGGSVAVRLYLSWWTNWQSVDANRSSVHFELRLQTYNYGQIISSAPKDWNIQVNGRWLNGGNTTIGIGNNSSRVIGSGDIELAHDSAGNCSFSASGYLNFSINFNGWVGGKTVTLGGSLNTIARASQPSCITFPNTTQNIGKMGDTITIHMNRKSGSFTHTVRYIFGNRSGTIATGVGDNCSWKIPLELADQITANTIGTGTIYADTFNGGSSIGTRSVNFNVSVADNMIPTMDTLGISVDNSANSTVDGWGLWVAGYSKAKITGSATGIYGSTIKSFTISGGTSATVTSESLNYKTGTIVESGSVVFNVAAIDSRGRKSVAKSTDAVTVYPYSNPSATQLKINRSSDDVTKMVVNANWTFSSVNGMNSTSGLLKYKEKNSSAWKTYGNIEKGKDVIIEISGGFLETKTWDFMLTVTDALGNSSQITAIVSTLDVLLNFRPGGKGLGIGKIAERDMMEVALPTDFMNDVYIDGTTLEQYIKGVAGGVVPNITISASDPPDTGIPNSIYIKMV